MRSLPSARLGWGFWARLLGLGIVDGLALWAFPTLYDRESWFAIGALAVGIAGLNYIFLTSRGYPFRYLAPGLALLAVFVMYPIGYTVYLSLTNFAQANNVSKAQALNALLARTTVAEDPDEYTLTIYRDDAGELNFLVVGEDGDVCYGTPRSTADPAGEPACEELAPFEEPPDEIDGYRKLRLIDLLQIENQVKSLALDTPAGEVVAITATTAQSGRVFRYAYDEARDVLIDNVAEVECPVQEGNFVCTDGRVVTPGWRVFVGMENYVDALTDRRIGGPLLRVFTWNVVFAVAVVFFQLAVGLGLAMTLHNADIRGKIAYRSMLILPYAVPGFITVLIWRGLFNFDFGPINRLIDTVSFGLIDPVPWLRNGVWAKVSVVLVTVWQGFPYMMLISMGALQSIPNELLEAARVDGASGWKAFWRVTFPMLMVIIAPLLIASFAFNFNSFVNIFLLTAGGPPVLGYDVPVGDTDLLITFTYTIAQGGGGRFALAATFAILIFLIVAAISAFSFRFTRRLEEIYGSL